MSSRFSSSIYSLAQAYQAAHLSELQYPENQIKEQLSGIIITENELSGVINMREIANMSARVPLFESESGEHGILTGGIRKNLKSITGANFSLNREILLKIRNPEFTSLISQKIGENRVPQCFQVQKLLNGTGLCQHSHSPDDIFVILHFDKNYGGGRYFEIIDGKKVFPDIPQYSIAINWRGVVHGVEEVTQGERTVMITTWEKVKLRDTAAAKAR